MDTFDIPETGRLAFRARIRNLQRLGLRPEAPGSGKRTQYSTDDICDLALALSLADVGLDPSRVVEHVPPGTCAEVGEGQFCIYLPVWFTKGRGQVTFIEKKHLEKLIEATPRFAVVSMETLTSRVCAALEEV